MRLTYEEKQRRRAAEARRRSAEDREREAARVAALPPRVVLSEEGIEARMAERRWMPDTPETEDDARRLNMGRKFNDFQVAETALSRAIYRRIGKEKVATTRGLLDPEEQELSPAAREAQRVSHIKVEGGSYEVPGPEKEPGL